MLRKCDALPAFKPGAAAGGDTQQLLAKQPLEAALAELRYKRRPACWPQHSIEAPTVIISRCFVCGTGTARGAANCLVNRPEGLSDALLPDLPALFCRDDIRRQLQQLRLTADDLQECLMVRCLAAMPMGRLN